MAEEVTAATVTPPPAPAAEMDIGERIREIAERRDSAKDQPAVEAKGAPVVAAPVVAGAPAADVAVTPAPEIDWEKDGLQVDHQMLRGRKPDEVVKMLTSAQAKIKELGTKARQLEERQRQPAAPPTQQVTQAQPEVGDPRIDEAAIVMHTNPARYREILREWNNEDFARQESQRTEQANARTLQSSAEQAHAGAIAAVAKEYGIDEGVAKLRMTGAVESVLKDHSMKVWQDFGGGSGDPEMEARGRDAYYAVWQDPEQYKAAYAIVNGATPVAQQPAIAVPNVTPRADPPGAKNVAPPPPRDAKNTVTLSADMERQLAGLGDIIPLSAEGTKKAKLRIAERMRG